MSLDAAEGLELIGQAYKEDTDETLFNVWNAEHLYYKEPLSFENYRDGIYKSAQKPKPSKLTAKEIIAQAEKIKAADQKRR